MLGRCMVGARVNQGKLTATVLEVAEGILGSMPDEEAPLMEAGLDSLSAVDFRNQADIRKSPA